MTYFIWASFGMHTSVAQLSDFSWVYQVFPSFSSLILCLLSFCLVFWYPKLMTPAEFFLNLSFAPLSYTHSRTGCFLISFKSDEVIKFYWSLGAICGLMSMAYNLPEVITCTCCIGAYFHLVTKCLPKAPKFAGNIICWSRLVLYDCIKRCFWGVSCFKCYKVSVLARFFQLYWNVLVRCNCLTSAVGSARSTNAFQYSCIDWIVFNILLR